MHHNSMGQAPEILQAQWKAAAEQSAKNAPKTPPAPPPVPQPQTAFHLPPPISKGGATSASAAPASETKWLDMLPDEELRDLGEKFLEKADGRWGRDTLIRKLLDAGITGEAAIKAPILK